MRRTALDCDDQTMAVPPATELSVFLSVPIYDTSRTVLIQDQIKRYVDLDDYFSHKLSACTRTVL